MQVEYKSVDPKLIVNEIRNGRSFDEIQKLFGLRSKSDVQTLYVKGLAELDEIPKASESAPSPPPPTRPVAESRRRRVVAVEHRKPAIRRKPAPPQPPQPPPKVKVQKITTANQRTIGQSGSVTLNKTVLIDQLGFEVGDSFEIFREDDKIILQKATN